MSKCPKCKNELIEIIKEKMYKCVNCNELISFKWKVLKDE